ncbi:hypothetical protein [Mycobacteroides salmoniphilum]|uniref:hypothetical protein n=1 Tax=Mycobacteroides salmoniphilum TaxID=404941 RepID=UPI001F1E8502|nr:hypothetical protein [Mycobacteroides salmoniphilum]
MWIRLALAPWWLQWPVYAVMIFGAAAIPVAVINREDEQGQWLGWWIGIAVVAVVGALVWSLAAWSRAPQLRQLLGGLTPGQYRQAAKAVLSGPIPADPAIRRAAARLAEQRRTSMPAVARKAMIWAMASNVVIQLVSAAFRPVSFVNFCVAVMLAAMGVFWWLYPPLLEARGQLLAGPSPATDVGATGPVAQVLDGGPDADRYQVQTQGISRAPQV